MQYTLQWLRNRSNKYLRPELKGPDTGSIRRYLGDEQDIHMHVVVFFKRSTRPEWYEMPNEYDDNGIKLRKRDSSTIHYQVV